MPHLVVNCTFNPPEIKLMGSTLREDTIFNLDQRLPTVLTTSFSPKKEIPKFTYIQNPPHWTNKLEQHFCNQLGRSLVFLCIIESLEREDWKLCGTNTVTHPDNGRDTTKFFFFRDSA